MSDKPGTSTAAEFDAEGSRRHWDRQHENRAYAIEMEAADRAYKAGLGVGEWEAFLLLEDAEELRILARAGYGTWGRERRWPEPSAAGDDSASAAT